MTLEAQYRRLSRLFPRAWRDQNEDDLVSTLLDAAEPDRRSVSLAEAADLVRGAVIVRARSVWAKPDSRPPTGEARSDVAEGAAGRTAWTGLDRAVRKAGLLGLALLSAGALAWMIRFWVDEVSLEFVVTSLVVVVIPGTGVVFTIASAIGGGWRRGLFAAVGCTLGIVPHVLAAVLGLSGVMQAGAAAFEVVRWLGVAYLVFMGVSLIRDRAGLRLDPDAKGGGASSDSTDSMGRVVWRGILLNLLNPKLTMFFFAFLPQFLDTPPGLLDPRLAGLSGAFMLMTLVVFVAYAWTGAAVRDRVLRAPGVLHWVQRSLGALLVGLAARLAVTDR